VCRVRGEEPGIRLRELPRPGIDRGEAPCHDAGAGVEPGVDRHEQIQIRPKVDPAGERLETAFRNRLAPGQFPYPFWHDEAKWSTYQGANTLLLWIDPKTAKIKVGQYTDRGATPPIVASGPVQQAKFDGRWMWTDADGHEQPQVTLFDGLFRADNPFLPKLDTAYKTLALKMRDGQCDRCHVPDNPHGTKRIVLLQTPAHAAGEIQRLMKAVREDKMPRDDTDIEQPLDDKLKSALLESGAAFEAAVQSAKDWEARAEGRSARTREPGE